MPIEKNTLVTLDYRLSSPEGETLHDEKDLMYVQGGYDQIFANVETALEGKDVGDTIRVALSPEDAFGEYDGSLVLEEFLSELPDELEVGMEIDGYSEENPDDVIIYTVKEIRGDKAVLDGNHPLAGQSVVFEATVKELQALDEAAVKEILEHHHHHDESCGCGHEH